MTEPTTTAGRALATLEDAITDVGRWCWWDRPQPDVFQVEFEGVQLWNDPPSPQEPPPSRYAIGVFGLLDVVFLSFAAASPDTPDDWPQRLNQDKIGPFQFGSMDRGRFTLTDHLKVMGLRRDARSVQPLVSQCPGDPLLSAEFNAMSFPVVGFSAGAVGLVVVGKDLQVFDCRGKALTPEEVLQRNARWWGYWRVYWERKGAGRPLPLDPSCELTVPLEGGHFHVELRPSADPATPPSSEEVLPCPKCKGKLRVPTDKGVLALRCPRCGHAWDWSPTGG
jgi:hypothetical protein